MRNRIAEFRQTAGLTQRQLAEKLNIHYQVLQRWENGDRTPTVDIAIQIAEVLMTTIEELFYADNLLAFAPPFEPLV